MVLSYKRHQPPRPFEHACKLVDAIPFMSNVTDFVHSSATRRSEVLMSLDTAKVFRCSMKGDMV